MKTLGALHAKIATLNVLGCLMSRTVIVGPGTKVVQVVLLASCSLRTFLPFGSFFWCLLKGRGY